MKLWPLYDMIEISFSLNKSNKNPDLYSSSHMLLRNSFSKQMEKIRRNDEHIMNFHIDVTNQLTVASLFEI